MSGFGNPNATQTFNIPQGGGGESNYELPPVGQFPGVVTGVYYLGSIMIKSSYGDAFKPRLMIEMTLEPRTQEGNHHVIYEEFTASCYGSAILGKFLSDLGGAKLDDNFSNFASVLWTVGMFNLAASHDGKYVNVMSAMPYAGQLNIDPSISQTPGKTTIFDATVLDLQGFIGLPRRAQKRALKSQEFQALYPAALQQYDIVLWDELNGNNNDNQKQAPQQQGFGAQPQQQGFGAQPQPQQQTPQQGFGAQQQPQQQTPQQGFGAQQQPQQQAQPQPTAQQQNHASQQFQQPPQQQVQQPVQSQVMPQQQTPQQGGFNSGFNQAVQAGPGQGQPIQSQTKGPTDFDENIGDDIPF